MENRDYILNTLFNNGKLNHYCLNKNWFIKNNKLDVYEKIFDSTSYLDCYDDVLLRERIYHIENDLKIIHKCPHCNSKVKFNKNKLSYNKICNSIECKRINSSITSKQMWKNFTEDELKVRNEKIKKYRIENPIVHTKEGIKKIKEANIGKVHSEITNRKRIESRRKNNSVWHSEESKIKISESNKKNFESSEFKKEHMIRLKKASSKISKIMKSKILNGEFTPPITNSWTNWESYVNTENGIKKFRSSWEAVFWLNNNKLLYEKIRIPYVNIDNKSKIYIVDFLDNDNKILFEIKPKSCINNKNNLLKEKFAKKWCNNNNFTYSIITDNWFFDNIKNVNFDGNEHLLKPMKQFL